MIKSPERDRHRLAGPFGEPVAGEAGDDTAADQRDEENCHGDREPPSRRREGSEIERLRVHQPIGDKQRADGGEDRQIAPVLPGDDLASGDEQQNGQEREVDGGGRPGAEHGRGGHGEPAGEPEQHQPEQGSALQRQPAGPVGNRGQ